MVDNMGTRVVQLCTIQDTRCRKGVEVRCQKSEPIRRRGRIVEADMAGSSSWFGSMVSHQTGRDGGEWEREVPGSPAKYGIVGLLPPVMTGLVKCCGRWGLCW